MNMLIHLRSIWKKLYPTIQLKKHYCMQKNHILSMNSMSATMLNTISIILLVYGIQSQKSL